MKTVQHIKGYNTDVLTWQQLFAAYSRAVDSGVPYECRPPGFFVVKPRSVEELGIQELAPVVDALKIKEAHIYFSLVTGNIGYGKHHDITDVWFWQCQGTSKWVVEGFTYMMNPGDLLFIPSGSDHSVESVTPRAGVSMSQVVCSDLPDDVVERAVLLGHL